MGIVGIEPAVSKAVLQDKRLMQIWVFAVFCEPLGLIFSSLRSKAALCDLIWKDTDSQGRKEPQT